jgi:hypothetical protein
VRQRISSNFLIKKSNSKQSDVAVIGLVSIILLSFLCNDITTGIYFKGLSLWLKISGLSVCIGYSLIKCMTKYSWDNGVLCIAMLMTAGGDYLLTIKSYSFWGIICFAGVHTMYSYRHCKRLANKQKKKLLGIAISLSIIILVTISQLNQPLFRVAYLYAGILVISLLSAIMMASKPYRTKKEIIILGGIVLFFLCDTCVALYNVTSGRIQSIVGVLIWVWYLPAQLLLSLSGDTVEYNKGEQ